jgi:alkyldihydroxyacetonephosphate synthase
VVPPASLGPFCTTEHYDRAAHTYGKSYPDYVRAMLGDYDCAPDVVAYPRNEAEISAVMDWAGSVGASLTPFGGGSSVCGGVEPRVDGIKHKAAVTLDLRNLSKVVEVDPVSRAASKPAPMVRPWKTSSSRMALRCGTSRRVLNFRRLAAGLRRDLAAILPVFTLISTISSKACAS